MECVTNSEQRTLAGMLNWPSVIFGELFEYFSCATYKIVVRAQHLQGIYLHFTKGLEEINKR